jgi:hypothetical protein
MHTMKIVAPRAVRLLAILLLMGTCGVGKAQTTSTAARLPFDKQWLKNGNYEMTCFVVADGRQVEISSFVIDIKLSKETLSIYTTLSLPGSSDQWIDTSIADATSFKPIYRSSYNVNQEMQLRYGTAVTGYHYDKKTKKRSLIKDAVKESFLDSYTYPYLLGLLPLTSGYSASLPVYDYKPEHTSHVKQAVIEEVKTSTYVSSLTGAHKVWQVTVLEAANNEKYDYYIDQETRRLWKIDILSKGQHLVMMDKEIDYNPFKNTFDKVATLQLIKGGSAVISGQVFARDNENGGLLKGKAILNINKKQFARTGTSIILIPFTEFFKEWIKLNEASRKKGRSIPLPKEATDCMKVTTVHDDKGHFEFVNLMPGDYLLYTEFRYVHTSHETEVVGYTDTYINGMFQGSTENTVTNSYQGNASAAVKKVVTIKKEGEKVEVSLKKTL